MRRIDRAAITLTVAHIFCSGLLEQLRDQCKSLWGTSSDLYFRVDKLPQQLANPNLHDIPTNLSFHIELWDRCDQHIRWVIAADVERRDCQCRVRRRGCDPSKRTLDVAAGHSRRAQARA
jgi:hypothetical protein